MADPTNEEQLRTENAELKARVEELEAQLEIERQVGVALRAFYAELNRHRLLRVPQSCATQARRS